MREIPAYILLGAVAGDMIGAPYEFAHKKIYEFPLFSADCGPTDDTYLTLAIAQAILDGRDYKSALLHFGRKYPSSYGLRFHDWLDSSDPQPYNSFGNGSAMRVSPVGWAFETEEAVLREAAATAAVTHNHPQGVAGAQAIALAIYRARKGASKDDIRSELEQRFGYDLQKPIAQIRPSYRYNEICQDTVPAALIGFLDSSSFEDAIRLAVSLGGDADTLAAIAGSVAEAWYNGVPASVAVDVQRRLPPELWEIITRFSSKYPR
jgi:ADP-ribosylglycohydrolase